jgi:hypothetical protein
VPIAGADGQVGTVDLSAYPNITRIEIVDVSMDLCGLVYDNFTFNTENLLELTVTDHNNNANKATAIDAAIRDLYVPEDPDTHTAKVDISALFDPNTNDTGKDIHYKIQRSDGFVVDDASFSSGSTKSEKFLPATNTADDYVIKAWLDSNHNNVCDNGEDTREVDVHVVPILKINNVVVSEVQTNTATFKVTLSHASDYPIYLLYSAKDVTTQPADLVTSSRVGSITFDPGDTEKSISIGLTQDNFDESTEYFRVSLVGSPSFGGVQYYVDKTSDAGYGTLLGVDLRADSNRNGSITAADDPRNNPNFEVNSRARGIAGGVIPFSVNTGSSPAMDGWKFQFSPGYTFQQQGTFHIWTSPDGGAELTPGALYAAGDIPSMIYLSSSAWGTGSLTVRVMKSLPGSTARLDQVGFQFDPPDIHPSVLNFLGNISTLASDPRGSTASGVTGVPYGLGSEYLDLNANGSIEPTLRPDGLPDPSGEHAFPVAYKAGSQMTLTGMLSLSSSDMSAKLSPQLAPSIRLRAFGPDGLQINPFTPTLLGDRGLSFTAEAFSAPLGTVDFYPEFKVDWQISFDAGTTWLIAGSSTQRLYVTLRDPSMLPGRTLFESLVWLGSSFAAGAVDEATVVAAAWSNFSDRSVSRVGSGTPMTYWAGGAAEATETAGLLADGNGQCGSWAELFQDVLAAQGIGAEKVTVTMADRPYTSQFAVGNWIFAPGPGSAGAGFDFSPYTDPATGRLRALRWVPGVGYSTDFVPVGFVAGVYTYVEGPEVAAPAQLGQGGYLGAPTSFYNHFVVRYDGKIYDPSYGGRVYVSQGDWEATSLGGFLITLIDSTGGYQNFVRKNPAGTDTMFSP